MEILDLLKSHVHEIKACFGVKRIGLVVDAPNLPREIQEELARRGLIPFVPMRKTSK